jgi:carboxyl-terminal processing protease
MQRLLLSTLGFYIAFLFTSCAQAQTTIMAETIIDKSQIEYYLVQAYNQATAESRIAINHIGLETESVGSIQVASAVIEGYPAHHSGIRRGDKILQVNGMEFHPVYSFNELHTSGRVIPHLDERFNIEIDRGGIVQSLSISPVHENLYDSYRTAGLNSPQQFNVGNKVIGYMRLWGLSRSTNDLLSIKSMIDELSQCDGIILDLRDASGFIDITLLDLIYRTRNNYYETAGENTSSFSLDKTVTISPGYYSRPLAVLINKNTRGGAELLAYQLNKSERVVTIGEATNGKIGGYRLDNQAGGYRYKPATQALIDGEQFEGVGLTPEISIDYPISQTTRSDPQFENAATILQGMI